MPVATHLEVTLAQHLATNMTADAIVEGVAATFGTDVYAGPEIEASPDGFTATPPATAIPHRAIFVLQTDGLDSETATASSDQTRPQEFEKPIFDIEVRGDLDISGTDDAYVAARDLAEAAKRAIHCRPPAGWVECFVLGTRARYEGKDDRERHRFLLRVRAEKQGTLGGT